MKSTQLMAICGLLAASYQPAYGSGFTDADQDLRAASSSAVDLSVEGAYRFRVGYFVNLDLDRGLTPSGDLLFPVPTGDPNGQTLGYQDMRLRSDIALRSGGGSMAFKMRADILDNVSLGGESLASAAGRSRNESDPIHVERAYVEILTPLGVLVAGRMGNHFGLGMTANGGDCFDCDGADAVDRVAFIVPVRNFIAAIAYDLTATGPSGQRRGGGRTLDLDRGDDARTVTIAFLRYRSDKLREIYRSGGRTTFDYGLAGIYSWQDRDVPADYLLDDPGPHPASMQRGFSAGGGTGWLRLTMPTFRLEAEMTAIVGTIDQPSLIPGVRFRDPVHSRQIGAAAETELGAPDARLGGGLNAGYASGDSAPGFGAFPTTTGGAAQPGDLEGAQTRPPHDNRIDNFRFSSDYRIDRILFREIIGTVTDAVYVRPHARARIWQIGPGELTATFAGIASWAAKAASTPSGSRFLGVELDSGLVYRSDGGFLATFSYAILFPGAAFDNDALGLSAKSAELVEANLGFVF